MPAVAVGEGAAVNGARTDSTAKDGAEEQEDPIAHVFTLVRQGKFSQAKKLCEAEPQYMLEADTDGHTLLHWAALAGDEDFVKCGLAAGAKVDAAALNGQTPFMWAMIKGMTGVAKLLMQAKADTFATDSMGATPCILTVQHQQHGAFLLLMSLDCREQLLKATDNNGCGVVHWAAYKGDSSALKLLDYFEADFSCLDEMQMTPLHRAVQASQLSICELLLDKQVEPSQTDNQGRTCLDIATSNHDTAMVRALERLLQVERSVNSVTLANENGVVGDVEAPQTGANLRRRDRSNDESDKFKKKALQNAAATFWLVSVSLAFFQYLTDLRSVSWTAAPNVTLCFELGVPASLALFFTVSLLDPGKVPARLKGCSGVEEMLRSFREGGSPDVTRLCTTTWVLKGLRTKYCTHTGACVDEFDHFCGWLNVAIGKGNHRPFIFLAMVEGFTQICHLYLCWAGARLLVQGSSVTGWMLNVAAQYPLMAFVAALHSITSPGIVMLTLNQLRLIGINLTTNEMINLPRYKHFWDETGDATGVKKRKFRNPFNKGGVLLNCLDFWWMRRRGELGVGKA